MLEKRERNEKETEKEKKIEQNNNNKHPNKIQTICALIKFNGKNRREEKSKDSFYFIILFCFESNRISWIVDFIVFQYNRRS